MRVAFYGDSLTAGIPGISFLRLLQQRYPTYELLNYGEGDDTVISLRRRILRRNLLAPADLAFIWIGTNDVPIKLYPTVGMLKRLRGKMWAQTPAEFAGHYRALLDLLLSVAPRIVTVSPLLIGEDPDNLYNRYLADISEIVCHISAEYSTVHYLDVRTPFISALKGQAPSPYLPHSILRTVRDIAASQFPDQVDRLAAARGLCLTIDGIHLNRRGASLIADQFAHQIPNP